MWLGKDEITQPLTFKEAKVEKSSNDVDKCTMLAEQTKLLAKRRSKRYSENRSENHTMTSANMDRQGTSRAFA